MQPYYERDGITLFHGDCREILPTLASESIDFILTDPPYLVSYSGRWGAAQGIIEGDSDPAWLMPVFGELWRTLKQNSLCLTFYGWPHAEEFFSTWRQVGFRPVSSVIFIKDRWGLGYFTRSQHEEAILLAKGNPPRPAHSISDVVEYKRPHLPWHPNEKPVAPISQVMSSYACSGKGLVLDPFCGSGTTLLAARSLGRRAVGIEIEEGYCELSALRLSQQTLDYQEPAKSEQLPLV